MTRQFCQGDIEMIKLQIQSTLDVGFFAVGMRYNCVARIQCWMPQKGCKREYLFNVKQKNTYWS